MCSNISNLMDRFSRRLTVKNINGCLTAQWKHELRLQRNFELYNNRHEIFAALRHQEDNSKALVQFWINMALNDQPPKEEWEPKNRVQIAWEHLTCYCEETCYWTTKQLANNNDNFWEEYLFYAKCVIYDFDFFRTKIAQYNAEDSSLGTYFTSILINSIKDKARVGKFSMWRRLYEESDKKLKEALFRYGIVEPSISRFIFARKYFKIVYGINKVQNPSRKKGQKWPDPDISDFEEAVNYYNSERLLPCATYEVSVGQDITTKTLQDWMQDCIFALQNYPQSITSELALETLYLKESVVSQHEEDEESREIYLQDFSVVEDTIENAENLVTITNKNLQQQLLTLKIPQQKVLILYYGFGLTQKQIEDILPVTQSAISRSLSLITRKLANILYGLSNPPEWVTQYVEIWLDCNYQTPIYSDHIHLALVEAERTLTIQEREVLRLRYGQKFDVQRISSELGIVQSELLEILRKTQAKLEKAVIDKIHICINEYLPKMLSNIYKKLVKTAHIKLSISQIELKDLEMINAVLDECLKMLNLLK